MFKAAEVGPEVNQSAAGPVILEPSGLTPPQREALLARLSSLADDELLLSHRDAEWIGHAPILEEDIALANIAQDELGHAIQWLTLRGSLDGSDPDRLAYFREPDQFCHNTLTELPKGDWAFTMVRQYLFDAWEMLWQGMAQRSRYQPLAQAAALALREERFHLEHTTLWIERLALGTQESARRTQAALNDIWPYALGLLEPLPGEAAGVEAGLLPDVIGLSAHWLELVGGHLRHCGLILPDSPTVSRGRHTLHLEPLLTEFQRVARQYPEARTW